MRPAYRQCTAAHKNHLSSSFCIQIGGRRPCLLFLPDGRARAAPHAFSRPARSLRVFRGLRVGLLRGERCPGLSRFASPPPRENKGRRSVVRGESRQKSGFRSKSRQNAMRIGQKHNKKHNKIKHVENIEKADVSCETMQNSPKSKRRKRTVGVGSRSRRARLSGGRKGVCCSKKERLEERLERLCAPARWRARKTTEEWLFGGRTRAVLRGV